MGFGEFLAHENLITEQEKNISDFYKHISFNSSKGCLGGILEKKGRDDKFIIYKMRII